MSWSAPHPAGLRECPNAEHQASIRNYGRKESGLIFTPGYFLDGYWHKCRYCHPERERTAQEQAAFRAGIEALEDVRLIPDSELFDMYWAWRLPQERWDNEWGKQIH